jgi:hypothetical protein
VWSNVHSNILNKQVFLREKIKLIFLMLFNVCFSTLYIREKITTKIDFLRAGKNYNRLQKFYNKIGKAF